MIPYSTRFLAWETTESPPSYVVPAGYVAIVRDVDVWSGGGAIVNVQLEITDHAKFWAAQFTIESVAQVAQWRGRVVLNPGEVLTFTADGPTDGVIGGYLLTAATL